MNDIRVDVLDCTWDGLEVFRCESTLAECFPDDPDSRAEARIEIERHGKHYLGGGAAPVVCLRKIRKPDFTGQTFLGHELRITDAIPDGHIMVQCNERILFFGQGAHYSLAWAHARNGNADSIFDLMQKSMETRRSVPAT